jgi:glycosyltransferase involved in cell wall biosynthesis
VFPGIEDFGIVPVECLACGRPVIGVDAGGVRDSVDGVRPWQDPDLVPSRHGGVFIQKERCGDAGALAEAIRYFASVEAKFTPSTLKASASNFGFQRFSREWRAFAREVNIPAPETVADAEVSTGDAMVSTGPC